MDSQSRPLGRLIKASETFLDPAGIRQVFAKSKQGRRDFIRSAFVAAGAAASAPLAMATSNQMPIDAGDRNILELPELSKGLGHPVVTDG